MQKFPSFFLLLLLYKIKAESGISTEQTEILSSAIEFESNLDEAPDESGNTTYAVGFDEPSDDDETNGSVDTNEQEGRDYNVSIQSHPRISRAEKKTKNLQCVTCYGSGITESADNCYSGKSSGRAHCADAETCYSELHPQYIKRGCILPSSINRTFVCKCPLCNDKPAEDPTYYEYKTIGDWQYDNERLEEPVGDSDLLCKVCETTGRSKTADKICKNGSRTDYMLCGHNQLCFTNVNLQIDYVSRGCIDVPVFNSIKFFCNFSSCNSDPYDNPARNKRSVLFKVVERPSVIEVRSSFATTTTAHAYLVVLDFFTLFLLKTT